MREEKGGGGGGGEEREEDIMKRGRQVVRGPRRVSRKRPNTITI